MADGSRYVPQTKVEWTSKEAYSQFRMWRKEVERILNGPMHKDNDSVKLNTVYIWAGAHAETLVEASQAEDPDLKIEKPTELLDCLSACLTHTTFFREAREDFYNITQKPGENTTTFYSRIMELYRLAEFPANSDFLVVDKLIHGCTNSVCKRKLMAKGKDVKVKPCLEILRQHEAVDVTMKRLEESQINAAYSRDPTKQSQRNGNRKSQKARTNAQKKSQSSRRQHNTTKTCTWCKGDPHAHENCPAKDAKCTFCHKKGHFEKACRIKDRAQNSIRSQNAVNATDEVSSDEDYDQFDIPVISINSIKKTREVLANVELHTTKPATLQGKVDTGAMATCMPSFKLKEVGLCQDNLQPSNARLRGVTGTDMKTCGELAVKATCNGITKKIKILVTELGTELILGLDVCKLFELVSIADTCLQRNITIEEQVEAVHITNETDINYAGLKEKWKQHLPLGRKTGDPLKDLKTIFPEMFDGSVGLFDGEVDLKVSPEAKPVQLPPRAVPISVMPKLKAELDKMEKEGIIRPCPETTDWVHNLVIVSKKNGDIRLCLDPKNLNKYLIRSVHYTASWEDAQHSFRNGQFFSTLDAKSGYWTKKLDVQSQPLTAFNTPFKKYCFVRLPFGLSVSSEIFSEEMDKAMAGIPGTFPCADDVKVQGSTEERHDIHLLETVDKASAAGIKFNPQKCQIKKRQIEYFGRVISPDGVKPCPQKVNAILKLQPPSSKQELQSFLGTVNFMATFIPNLSKKTFMMRGLMKKDVHFVWTSDMQQEFENIKQAMANAVDLTHFDPTKPTIIETDASLKGLGAVLIQDGKPIKFLSKSLTQTESNYSNIERELLAVLFACEKLHVYVFGRTITIHTDHQPLESIFRKPISLAPARLQRMLLRMRMYSLQVKYVGAKSVLVADTLSRLIKPGTDPAIPNLDINISQVLKIRPTHLESLKEESKADPVLAPLHDRIAGGWPDSMHDLPKALYPYWCFRDELTILDGLIMKGNRVIVPSAQRAETLARLHDGHQGLTATLQRARRTVYWPNMQDDISALLQRCNECQIHAKKKPRAPERQVSASRPMEIIGVDLMEFRGKIALVSVDYHTGFLTIDFMQAGTSDEVIQVLNNNFRKFGLAERIISDNGPCFKSEKFRKFCTDLEIKHTTSSPHYHEGNGRAERSIQTIKQILKKSNSDIKVTMAIIAYHDTPSSSDLPSPAELFFNRRINTRLGLMHPPTVLTDAQKTKLSEKRAAHLITPQKDAKDEYTPNQPIWFTEDGCPEWKPGYIESRDLQPDSYWIINTESNRRLRRNRHDIKPRFHIPTPKYQDTVPSYRLLPPASTTQQNCTPTTETSEARVSDTPPQPMEIPPDPVTPTPEPTTPIKEQKTPRTKPTPLPAKTPVKTRSGRMPKSNRDPNFVYRCVESE